MNKVVSINLNGNAYQLEEPGFDALSAYLAQAKAQLAGNPDQGEIVADLEQAIADKFRRFLNPHKSVVTSEEVAGVIREMGPVGEGEEAETGAAPKAGPKKLYRVQEGEMIAGIANGVAAYLNVDVVPVRIIFVVLIFITSGGFIAAYLLAWIFIPVAVTQEQRAEASGAAFNAEELISRAKTEYAKLDGKRAEWKRQWKDWKKDMNRRHDEHKMWRRYGQTYQAQWSARRHRPSFVGELLQVIVVSFALWFAYHRVPPIHDFMDAAWQLWQRLADQIAQFILTHH